MPTYFSWGVFSLFTYLVPHISIEIGKFFRSLTKSSYWSEDPARLQIGKKIVVNATLMSILGSLVVILITAGLVSHFTK